MEGLTIHISWEYFLAIMGAIIGVAWYSNGRFTALETSMDWVKDALKEVKLTSDNFAKPAFASQSPINLTPVGEQWLNDSGLKKYIEQEKENLAKKCDEKKNTNPYEVQKHVFKIFDDLNFGTETEDNLKKFAFEKGTTMDVMRRVGAIYYRNICLENFGMKRDDIDKHDPLNKG